MPKTALMRVDLPAPFGPITATSSSGYRWKETPRRIGTSLSPATMSLVSSSGSTLASEIRFDHRRVRPDDLGAAFRDHAPLMHDDHPVAVPKHDVHVVLDEEERPTLGPEPLDEGGELRAHAGGHAGPGFVGEEAG